MSCVRENDIQQPCQEKLMKVSSENSRTIKERIVELTQRRNGVAALKTGVLLTLSQDIIIESDSNNQHSSPHSSWNRIKNLYAGARGDMILSGSLVLCLEHLIIEGTGVRSIKFMYNQKTYTIIGYYLPEEIFSVVPSSNDPR